MKTSSVAAMLLFALMAFGVTIGDIEATRSKRIVGGSATGPGEFNYVVSIGRNNKHSCGGAILSPRHIITAAHCVNAKRAPTIYYGSHDLKCYDEVHNVTAERIYYSENFDVSLPPGKTGYDIAILVLSKDLEIDKANVGIVLLPDSKPNFAERHVVAGFGDVDFYRKLRQRPLRKAIIRLLDDATCKLKGGTPTGREYLCAIGWDSSARLACGDSGAPLVNPEKKLVGIVSHCDAENKNPHFYVNVYNIRTAIRQIMAKRPVKL